MCFTCSFPPLFGFHSILIPLIRFLGGILVAMAIVKYTIRSWYNSSFVVVFLCCWAFLSEFVLSCFSVLLLFEYPISGCASILPEVHEVYGDFIYHCESLGFFVVSSCLSGVSKKLGLRICPFARSSLINDINSFGYLFCKGNGCFHISAWVEVLVYGLNNTKALVGVPVTIPHSAWYIGTIVFLLVIILQASFACLAFAISARKAPLHFPSQTGGWG